MLFDLTFLGDFKEGIIFIGVLLYVTYLFFDFTSTRRFLLLEKLYRKERETYLEFKKKEAEDNLKKPYYSRERMPLTKWVVKNLDARMGTLIHFGIFFNFYFFSILLLVAGIFFHYGVLPVWSIPLTYILFAFLGMLVGLMALQTKMVNEEKKKYEEFSGGRISDKLERDDIKKLRDWIKNYFEDWRNIIFVLIGGVIVYFLAEYNFQNDSEKIISIMALYFSISAVLLGIGVPTVSLNIASGRKFFEKRVQNPKLFEEIIKDKDPREPNKGEWEQLCVVRVSMENVSRFPGRFYLELHIEVDGERIAREHEAPLYHGKEAWTLLPHKGVEGWFDINRYLEKAGTNMPHLKSSETERYSILMMKAKVRNAGFFGLFIHYPELELYFDFKEYNWYNKKYGYNI